jgi:hypothetical protein
MAALDSIFITDPVDPVHCGSAFRIRGSVLEDYVCSPDPGWEVEVKTGSKYVVARSSNPLGTHEEARDQGFRVAQKGLDILAIKRFGELGIRDPKDVHIIWWNEAGVPTLRLTLVTTHKISTSATVTVSDRDGKPVLPPPPTTWHESLRYFRLSQVSDDLFDAFRNLYLAIESILDHIEPQHLASPPGGGAPRPAEGEGQWLRRALAAADRRIGLARFARAGSADPVQDFFEDIYASVRGGLFHAKGSRTFHLPHDEQVYPAVSDGFARLNNLFIALVGNVFGIQGGSGGFTHHGFNMMVGGLEPHLSIFVTEDNTISERDASEIVPGDGTVLQMRSVPTTLYDGPFLKGFLGTLSAGELSTMPTIRSAGALVKQKPYCLTSLGCVIHHAGFSNVQTQLGIRMRNSRMSKTFFGT